MMDRHAINLCKNQEDTSMRDFAKIAEAYLAQEELLDDTSTVPHIQLKRSLRYKEYFLVDALYKGDDGKLHWYITESYELPNEGIQEVDFDDIPVWLIYACLKQIDSMVI